MKIIIIMYILQDGEMFSYSIPDPVPQQRRKFGLEPM